jgi:adenosylcobinamide kinase/adenosylcobinamide-phosphate guanylyltransferase
LKTLAPDKKWKKSVGAYLANASTILITGGARSGKSRYAEQRAGELGARRLYIATAEPKDEEMAQRIAAHRRRRGAEWTSIEEPLELLAVLREQRGHFDCVLVDCLTLWLSNLLLQRNYEHAIQKVQELCEATPSFDFNLLLVTNEVGWGIVPENPLARQFRDLLGWANQEIASVSDQVVLLIAGIPIAVKKAT